MSERQKHWPDRVIDAAGPVMVLPMERARGKRPLIRSLWVLLYPPWFAVIGLPIFVAVIFPCLLCAMWYELGEGH